MDEAMTADPRPPCQDCGDPGHQQCRPATSNAGLAGQPEPLDEAAIRSYFTKTSGDTHLPRPMVAQVVSQLLDALAAERAWLAGTQIERDEAVVALAAERLAREQTRQERDEWERATQRYLNRAEAAEQRERELRERCELLERWQTCYRTLGHLGGEREA